MQILWDYDNWDGWKCTLTNGSKNIKRGNWDRTENATKLRKSPEMPQFDLIIKSL